MKEESGSKLNIISIIKIITHRLVSIELKGVVLVSYNNFKFKNKY